MLEANAAMSMRAPSAAGSSSKEAESEFPDLVFVSMEDWDAIWRRNQFLCAAITRRFPKARILFVGLSRHLPRCVATGKIAELWRDRSRPAPEYPNITVTHALRIAPDRHPAGRRLNEALVRRHVRGEMRRLRMSRPLLWLNPHYAVHMAGRMSERAVVYDITDDWSLATQSESERELLIQQDRALCSRADLVVVCSEALRESRKALARRLLLLPNGVDARHYAEKRPGNSPWPAPVFGYTGTLHGDRVDVDLVIELARAYPSGTVALVGPNHLAPDLRSRLEALPNVRLTGPVPYAELPQRMAAFDVCIVPHRESPFTESLNPIKLWEYLAFGRPVVSTKVAGFRDYGQLCRLASGPAAFVAACGEALQEGDRLTAARQAEAARHSWEARLDVLVEALRTAGAS